MFNQLPSLQELCLCTRQLATLLTCGVPPLSALETVTAQTSSAKLRRAIAVVGETLVEGGSLAEGFSATPEIFSRLYISLVAAGEKAGILDRTLDTLIRGLERSRILRSQLARAALYPTLVLLTLCAVTIFLLTWVVPTFEELFQESGVRLPWLTEQILAISRYLCLYWTSGLVGLVLGVALISWLYTHSLRWSTFVERIKLRLPFFARVLRARLACESTSLLSALLGAGIPIIEALEITAQTVQYRVLSSELMQVRDALHDGASLSKALSRSEVLPPIVSQMVSVGEASGQLEEMLSRVGVFLDEEVESALKNIQDLAEPILILCIGLVVGTLVLALYLPLFQLGQLAGTR